MAAIAGSEVVQPHLSSAERLLWVGQPDASRHFNKTDTFAIPFSLLWGGFMIWALVAAVLRGDVIFALLIAPLVPIALFVLVGRFFVRARLRSRTWYVVTDQRVLKIQRKGSRADVAAVPVKRLPAVSCDRRSDGSGSVVFGPRTWLDTDFPVFALDHSSLGFFDIPNAAYVAELVTQLREAQPEC